MRKLILSIAVLSAAGLGALGCGGEEEAASGASELVPAGAALYAETTLSPEGEQKEALDAIVAKFPGGGDKLKGLLDKHLRQSDAPVSFREDIEPWLGDQAAVFAQDAGPGGEFRTVAGVVATEDEEKTLEALEKTAEGEITRKAHNDIEYLMDESGEAAAVFDGFLVLGSEPGVKAVIDTSKDGSPLSDDENYKNAVEGAAEDRLGLFYVNSPEFLKTLRRQGAPVPDSVGKFFEEPTVATFDADADGVTLEGNVPEDLARASLFGRASDLLAELPADSFAAVGQTDFGQLLDFYVEFLAGIAGGRDMLEQQFQAATGLDLQEDVLAWMGDYGIFVRGSSPAELDGALIVETSDEEASGRALAALERLSRDQAAGVGVEIRPLAVPGGGDGFTISGGAFPKPVHAFQRDGRVVFAFGDSAATDAAESGEKLGDSADFSAARDALGEDVEVSAYVLMQPIFDLVESSGAASDADWQRVKPYLEPLSAVVSGTAGEGDDLRYVLKLVVK